MNIFGFQTKIVEHVDVDAPGTTAASAVRALPASRPP
jgi:hypothetical protein